MDNTTSDSPRVDGPQRQTRLGVLVRDCREQLGFSIEKLANEIGTDPSTISNYESGRRTPQTSNLLKLAKKLGITSTQLLTAAALDRLKSEDKKDWDPETHSLYAEMIAQIEREFKSQPIGRAISGSTLTLQDWPQAFDIKTVIVGDRREFPPKTYADLLALTASTCDLTFLNDLDLHGARIRSDKIVKLSHDADLRKKLDHDILIVGSPAANLAARMVNDHACFRFAIEDKDRASEAQWERDLEHIADDGFELSKLVNPDDKEGRERLRRLRTMYTQFAKPGMIDPIDFTGDSRGVQRGSNIDYGLISLCANPWSETGVVILAAGIGGPGTAMAVKVLSDPKHFKKHPLGGIIKVWIPNAARWEDRFERLNFEWETHPYDVDRFKKELASPGEYGRPNPFSKDSTGISRLLACLDQRASAPGAVAQ